MWLIDKVKSFFKTTPNEILELNDIQRQFDYDSPFFHDAMDQLHLSNAIKLAAEVPVTPIAPTLIESFQLIALLPACVSPTGIPKVSEKSRRVSAACE